MDWQMDLQTNRKMKRKKQNTFFAQFLKLLCLVLVVMLAVVIFKKSANHPAETTAPTAPTDTTPTVTAPTTAATTPTVTTTHTVTTATATTTRLTSPPPVTTSTTKATTTTTTATTSTTATYEPGYISRIPTDSEMRSLIADKLLDINKYSRPANKYLDKGVSRQKITKIVIHYVANAGTSAINNRNYFNNLPKNEKIYAGAHYIVGLEGEIIRCIPDNEIAYHAGNADVNACSIGIEVCHPDKTGRFSYKSYLSLLKLVSWLCDKYDISADNVIRHYDVTGKACPIYYIDNPSEWRLFKKRLIFR